MEARADAAPDAITPQAADLIGLRAWIGRLRLRVAGASGDSGANEGQRRGGLRGRGLDFAELRAYQSGDDVRSIDWRHAARHGVPATRRYREEHDQCVRLLVDLGPSMQFGTRVAYKSVVAARAAALTAWVATAGGDRVGGLVWHGGQWTESRAQPRRAGALGLIRELTANGQAQVEHTSSTFGDGFRHLGCQLASGDRLVIISDFRSLDAEAETRLITFARRAACYCVHVYDPFEANPPPPGSYSLSDGVTQTTIDFADLQIRQNYAAAFVAHRARLEALATKTGSRLMHLATNSPLGALPAWLGR